MKFRLQLSVAISFTVLTVVVLGIAVTLFYISNRDLALETAKSSMNDARAKTDSGFVNVVAPVGRAVETMDAFLRAFPEEVGRFEGLTVVKTQIDDLDQVYGAYFGIEDGGAFHQVVHLQPRTKTFGTADAPVPDGAAFVFRSVRPTAGGRMETYTYLTNADEVIAEDTSAGDFDPRQRPWYKLAKETDHLVISPVYIFESTGRPGVTFSKRVMDPHGRLLGVAGADMSLDGITEVLNDIRIGEMGEVFILDHDGRMITQSDYAGGGEENPVVKAAISEWRAKESDFFRFVAPDLGDVFLASVTPLSSIYNIEPKLGVIVPERQFVGAINDSTRRVLNHTLIIILIAVFATVLLARLLSGHLRLVAEEARRISDFDLDGDFDLDTRIVEVSELGAAVSNMKNSLRSFGAYVPKDLVRSIVSSGGSVTIGGTSRELSILFSDIEGFTSKTEMLPPEMVMRDLSRYFEAMETEIFGNRGTIDKYIGDAIMAIWNAPARDPDHAEHACRAALACRTAEKRLNENAVESEFFPIRTRFGLHADQVVVGNVGSARRLQYTAIGGAVNLASRVEALNKIYGTEILVTQSIVDRVADRFMFRPVDLVSPAGTTMPIMVHELIGESGSRAAAPIDEPIRREIEEWTAFYQLYQSRCWAEALTALRALQNSSSRPDLVAIYRDRCNQFIDHPPPENWDGVRTYMKK